MTEVDQPDIGPCPCGPCVARAQTKHVRFWRWLTSLDLVRPPAPLLRWLGLLLIAVVYLAAGAHTQLHSWLWVAVLGGFLILPDIAGFAVGGFRLDLKKAQDDITALRVRLDVRQQVINHIVQQSTDVAVAERTPRRARVFESSEEDSGQE